MKINTLKSLIQRFRTNKTAELEPSPQQPDYIHQFQNACRHHHIYRPVSDLYRTDIYESTLRPSTAAMQWHMNDLDVASAIKNLEAAFAKMYPEHRDQYQMPSQNELMDFLEQEVTE